MALSVPLLYSYKAYFIQILIKDKQTEAKAFDLNFNFIDDVLWIQTLLTGFHYYTPNDISTST